MFVHCLYHIFECATVYTSMEIPLWYCANKAVVSDSWVRLFPVSLIPCDRMSLARPVKQQMFFSNLTTGLAKIPSGTPCVWSSPTVAQV